MEIAAVTGIDRAHDMYGPGVDWSGSPVRIIPIADSIHIWRIDLGNRSAAGTGSLSLLSTRERERAASFKLENVRRAFVAARAGLRTVLARYVGIPAPAIKFGVGIHGKPFLFGTKLRFNLTHSGDLGLVAVAADREVGIDIETIRPIDGSKAIAEQFFSHAECEELRSAEPACVNVEFLRIWTRKEARVKAMGKGLSAPLSGREYDNEEARWTLISFVPQSGYVASVAILGNMSKLEFYSNRMSEEFGPD